MPWRLARHFTLLVRRRMDQPVLDSVGLKLWRVADAQATTTGARPEPLARGFTTILTSLPSGTRNLTRRSSENPARRPRVSAETSGWSTARTSAAAAWVNLQRSIIRPILRASFALVSASEGRGPRRSVAWRRTVLNPTSGTSRSVLPSTPAGTRRPPTTPTDHGVPSKGPCPRCVLQAWRRRQRSGPCTFGLISQGFAGCRRTASPACACPVFVQARCRTAVLGITNHSMRCTTNRTSKVAESTIRMAE